MDRTVSSLLASAGFASGLLVAAGLVRALPAMAADTVQDFDSPGAGTPWTQLSLGPPPPCLPLLLDGGPAVDGRFLRIAHGLRAEAGCLPADPPSGENVNSNSVTFDRSHAGAASEIVVDFDLRFTPATGRADGLGFALLATSVWGTSGGVGAPAAPFVAEEPSFSSSLGIGFDIFQSDDLADVDDNHLSIHFNETRLAEISVNDLFDLGGGKWFHVRIHVHFGAGSSELTVELTSCSGRPVVLIDRFPVPGMSAYEARAYFAARSGGLTADFDLDNVRVVFRDSPPEILSFVPSTVTAREDGAAVEVVVHRAGTGAGTVSIEVQTQDLTATAGSDYSATSSVLTFSPGQTRRSVSVPLLDDAVTEGEESFRVALQSPSTGAVLGGPSALTVVLVDDETARVEGHWSPVLCWPVVPIHLHLLPTGKILFWGRVGEGELPGAGGGNGAGTEPFDQIRVWDPATLDLTSPALPPHDIFCSGHTFLADGRLLVTGGNVADNVGLPHATAYDPFADSWSLYPDMNAGRWYPTSVLLPDGDVAVESGDIAPGTVNTLPQVLDVRRGFWRSLTDAQAERPVIADLYPRLLLAPDGRIFKAGPDRDSWFLDTSGAGDWVPGPLSSLTRPRTYGPAVIRDSQVLLIGGGDPPSDSVDVIELSAPNPLWQSTGPLALPRRHHNATVLPDGSVLATGGTSSPGFNVSAAAVRFAEVWNPVRATWTPLASMQTKRIYHSTAVLLPDARVLVAGGGQPNAEGDFDHRDAEIFSPPYLFKGPRPVITSAPLAVGLGEVFEVVTPQAASILQVSLVRPGSATHAFDQSQRLVTVAFTPVPGGLGVELPANPNLLLPGPYMLFLVDNQGIPSVAHMISVGLDLFRDGFETGDTSRWTSTVP